MKRVLQLLALLVLYLLFSAKSCDNREQFDAVREQKKIRSAKDSIAEAFGTVNLSQSALQGYDQTAIFRFIDFMDYTAIVTDTSIAPAFRTHARQMIKNLFISNKNVFTFSGHRGNKKEEILLSELIDEKSLLLKPLIDLKSDSIWVLNNLHPLNDSTFEGRIAFSTGNSVSAAEAINYNHMQGTIAFYAARRNKNFGNETLKVWTVLLGDAMIQEK